ncbi:MAG TPA: DUF1538 domain-containing protein [Caldisericia bacterium]|nr:DUF1538 domain-containing protein [Caldisericia bacterium]
MKEVLYSIIPITVFVLVLQVFLTPFPAPMLANFIVGALFMILGMILFLAGIRSSLLEFGEAIGKTITLQGKLWMVIVFGFMVGFVVTVAEPAVQVLALQIDQVSMGSIGRWLLILFISIGVGVFVALSLLRILFNIPMIYLLIGGYVVIFILSIFSSPQYIPVSFDAGGVTTGPMTVPFILALGMGFSTITRSRKTSEDSFGLVALASIGPIIAVMLLGILF